MFVVFMRVRRSPSSLIAFLFALVLTVLCQAPAIANGFNAWFPTSTFKEILPSTGQEEVIVERCVYLDGRCIFRIAAPRSEVATRLIYIQTQINQVKTRYDEQDDPDVQITKKIEGNLNNIEIVTEGESIHLMTVTRWDAEIQGEDQDNRTLQIIDQIEAGLERAREERTPEFLKRQGILAGGIALVAIALHLIGRSWEQNLKKQKTQEIEFPHNSELISTQLTLRQKQNIREVQFRLSQLLQGGAIAAAAVTIVGLFPQTRITQVWLLSIFQYPLRIALISLIAYLAVRLSYALIAKVNQLLAAGALEAFTFITQESNQRLQQRVNTFSQVMRSIVTLIILAIALIICLGSLNINIAPILAGAGIIGLAISFAAQNLLKDVINGFCIILEDQYAVGDVINVGGFGGLVENMNLRITQIRDSEGRLITIPNSEVRIVANLSNQWSRADLNIPVPYQTDVDFALQLMADVAQTMRTEEAWREKILEDPLVLGVDNFHERGMMIKIWLKTIPLKQWEVAREYRRRLKIAFEEAGINIPTIHSDLLLHSPNPEI